MDDELFHLELPEEPAGWPTRRRVLVGAAATLVVAVVGLAVTLGSGSGPAAPSTQRVAGSAAHGAAPAVPAAVRTSVGAAPTGAAPSPATGATGTTVPTPAPPDPVKDTSTPMPPAERAAAQAELQAFAAADLRTPVSLTSPAGWAGRDADQPDPAGMASCPHLADRLAAALGGRWTYTYGSLPTAGGCSWTPVPWVPEADPAVRFFESVGFVPGADVRSPDAHVLYQAAGTQCPEVDVPAVGPGAFAARCQDPDDLTYTVALPDAGGRGVWYLSTYAGHAQRGHTAQQGLLALLGAADAVY